MEDPQKLTRCDEGALSTQESPPNDPSWVKPAGQAGVDSLGLASGTGPVINSGDTVYQIFSTPQLTSDVQGRLNNTLNNNGWMFLGSSEGVAGTARRFSSTEVTGLGIASALTPRIIVDYTISAIPEPSSAVALGIIGAFAATMRRRKA